MAYLPLSHLGHAPPFELRKNLAYGKNATKMRHIFRQKPQKFSGEGAQPPPQTLLPMGREIPLTRPLTLGAAALDPLQIFFPISIITLDTDAVINEFGKSNRRLQFY